MYKCASFQFFWAGTSLLILVTSYYTLITNLFGYFLTSTEVLFCNLQLGEKCKYACFDKCVICLAIY